MSRAKARETAFRMAFQMDMGKNDFEVAKETMIEAMVDGEITKKDCPYIEDVVQGIFLHQKEFDSFIEEYAKGWTLNRINPMDRNIIRLALYEVWYVEDIPLEIALNEAVELAKLYGEDDSYSFVNGILDNAKDLSLKEKCIGKAKIKEAEEEILRAEKAKIEEAEKLKLEEAKIKEAEAEKLRLEELLEKEAEEKKLRIEAMQAKKEEKLRMEELKAEEMQTSTFQSEESEIAEPQTEENQK